MPSIGTLEIYTEVPEGTVGSGPVSEFYWRHAGCPDGRGPFISLWACVSDFKTTITKSKENPPTPPTPLKPVPKTYPVVRLDFNTKKRL